MQILSQIKTGLQPLFEKVTFPDYGPWNLSARMDILKDVLPSPPKNLLLALIVANKCCICKDGLSYYNQPEFNKP